MLRHGVACDCVFVAESPAESPGVTELATGVVPSPSPDDHPLDATWLTSVLNPSTAKHNGKWLAVFAGECVETLGDLRHIGREITVCIPHACMCVCQVYMYVMHVCVYYPHQRRVALFLRVYEEVDSSGKVLSGYRNRTCRYYHLPSETQQPLEYRLADCVLGHV